MNFLFDNVHVLVFYSRANFHENMAYVVLSEKKKKQNLVL